MRSKYCFRPEDLSSVVFWFDNVYTRAITEHPGDPVYLICYAGTKKKTANLRGLQFFSLKKDLPFYGRFFVQKSPDFFLLPSVLVLLLPSVFGNETLTSFQNA